MQPKSVSLVISVLLSCFAFAQVTEELSFGVEPGAECLLVVDNWIIVCSNHSLTYYLWNGTAILANHTKPFWDDVNQAYKNGHPQGITTGSILADIFVTTGSENDSQIAVLDSDFNFTRALHLSLINSPNYAQIAIDPSDTYILVAVFGTIPGIYQYLIDDGSHTGTYQASYNASTPQGVSFITTDVLIVPSTGYLFYFNFMEYGQPNGQIANSIPMEDQGVHAYSWADVFILESTRVRLFFNNGSFAGIPVGPPSSAVKVTIDRYGNIFWITNVVLTVSPKPAFIPQAPTFIPTTMSTPTSIQPVTATPQAPPIVCATGTCRIEGDYIIAQDISIVGNSSIVVTGDVEWKSGSVLTLDYLTNVTVKGCLNLTNASIELVPPSDTNSLAPRDRVLRFSASECDIDTNGLMVDFGILECVTASLDTSELRKVYVLFDDTCQSKSSKNAVKYSLIAVGIVVGLIVVVLIVGVIWKPQIFFPFHNYRKKRKRENKHVNLNSKAVLNNKP